MPRGKPAPRADMRVIALIDQMESFATALQLMALGLDDIPKEYAGAVAANATEIRQRLEVLRSLLPQNI
jgi:hypothetical protein